MKALTDEHLAARAQTGDRHAVDELMRRYERAATGAASEFYFPGDITEAAHELQRIVAAFTSLSPLERRAILTVINGDNYSPGGVKDKQIDNAAQRARRKLRAAA